MLNNQRKNKLITAMQNMSYSTWVQLNKYSQEEQAYVLFCIQNQKSGAFETDGISYQPETHTKFRKLDVNYEKYLNKAI